MEFEPNMTSFEVKQEAYELMFNVTIEFDHQQKPKIILIPEYENTATISSSKFDSDCPNCQCSLAIKLQVYENHYNAARVCLDTLDTQQFKVKEEIEDDEVNEKLTVSLLTDWVDQTNEANSELTSTHRTKRGRPRKSIIESTEPVLQRQQQKRRRSPLERVNPTVTRPGPKSKQTHRQKVPETLSKDKSDVPQLTDSIIHNEAQKNEKPLKENLTKDLTNSNKNDEPNGAAPEDHTKQQKDKKAFYCTACFETFNTQEELKEHMSGPHDLTCKFCPFPKVFNTSKLLRQHVKMYHTAMHPNYQPEKVCTGCNKYLEYGLRKHHKRCQLYKKLELKCPMCDKVYKTTVTRDSHLINVHGKGCKPVICEQCGEEFTTEKKYNFHYNIVHANKMFICDLCPVTNNRFRSKGIIISHIKYQHLNLPKKMTSCPVCGIEVETRMYNSHMKRHSDPDIECKVCGKRFYNQSRLKTHAKLHSSERNYECGVCGSRFKMPETLRTHLRLHTGFKPYVCEVCTKAFSDRSCYRIHLMKHERDLGITLDKSIKKFSNVKPQTN